MNSTDVLDAQLLAIDLVAATVRESAPDIDRLAPRTTDNPARVITTLVALLAGVLTVNLKPADVQDQLTQWRLTVIQAHQAASEC